MAPLHRPQTPFEALLHELIEDSPGASLADCVQEAVQAYCSCADGIAPEQTAQPVHLEDAQPEDMALPMFALMQALMLRDMFASFTVWLVRVFGNCENFDVDALLDEGEFGDELRKPMLTVYAELDEDGTLRLFWDDDDFDSDYLLPPVTDDSNEERSNQLLELGRSHWDTQLPEDATPTQRQLVSLVPVTALNCLRNVLDCLDGITDLRVGDWPVLSDNQLKIVTTEERFVLHLLLQTSEAKRRLAVVSSAATKALYPHGIQSVAQFLALRKTSKKSKSALAQAISRVDDKACSITDVERLTRYVEHVQEAQRLMRAFYAVGKRCGFTKAELDVAASQVT